MAVNAVNSISSSTSPSSVSIKEKVPSTQSSISGAQNLKITQKVQEEDSKSSLLQAPVKIEREDAETLAEVMNKVSKFFNHELNFEVFEDLNRVYVQVVDPETKEVLKQFPPEELLELQAKIKEMVGIIMDEYV